MKNPVEALIDDLCDKYKTEYADLARSARTNDELEGYVKVRKPQEPATFHETFRYQTLCHLFASYGKDVDRLERDYP